MLRSSTDKEDVLHESAASLPEPCPPDDASIPAIPPTPRSGSFIDSALTCMRPERSSSPGTNEGFSSSASAIPRPTSPRGFFSQNLSSGSDSDAVAIPKEYQDPTTGLLMKNPCVYALNGISYEESSLRNDLEKNRKPRSSTVKMLPNQHIEDVIIPNVNLKNLIDRFKLQHSLLGSPIKSKSNAP